MQVVPDPLLEAYRRATYHVDLPAGRVALRVGSASREVDAWLLAIGRTVAVQITAHNPMSRPLDADENDRRHAVLLRDLHAGEMPCASGVNTGGGWPDEAALLVAPRRLDEALDLARKHGQRAVVVIGLGEPADLLDLAARP